MWHRVVACKKHRTDSSQGAHAHGALPIISTRSHKQTYAFDQEPSSSTRCPRRTCAASSQKTLLRFALDRTLKKCFTLHPQRLALGLSPRIPVVLLHVLVWILLFQTDLAFSVPPSDATLLPCTPYEKSPTEGMPVLKGSRPWNLI